MAYNRALFSKTVTAFCFGYFLRSNNRTTIILLMANESGKPDLDIVIKMKTRYPKH